MPESRCISTSCRMEVVHIWSRSSWDSSYGFHFDSMKSFFPHFKNILILNHLSLHWWLLLTDSHQMHKLDIRYSFSEFCYCRQINWFLKFLFPFTSCVTYILFIEAYSDNWFRASCNRSSSGEIQGKYSSWSRWCDVTDNQVID